MQDDLRMTKHLLLCIKLAFWKSLVMSIKEKTNKHIICMYRFSAEYSADSVVESLKMYFTPCWMHIYFFSVPQLPERLGENLPARLHPNSAGCFAHTCEDHRDRWNSLHVQRTQLQVSTASYCSQRASFGRLIEQLLSTLVYYIYKHLPRCLHCRLNRAVPNTESWFYFRK